MTLITGILKAVNADEAKKMLDEVGGVVSLAVAK